LPNIYVRINVNITAGPPNSLHWIAGKATARDDHSQ
jgi:hypothetical protein